MEKKKLSTLNLSLLIMLIFALAVLKVHFSLVHFQAIEKKPDLPAVLGQWCYFREIPISEAALNVLGTKSAALADYEDGKGDLARLYILASYGRRSSIHEPEFCYAGSGKNDIIAKGETIIGRGKGRPFPVNYFILDTDYGYQAVMYTYTVGQEITSSYLKQQILFVVKRFKKRNVLGRLIRVSKFCKNKNYSKDLAMLEDIMVQEVKDIKLN